MRTHGRRQCFSVTALLLTMALAAYQVVRLAADDAGPVRRIEGGSFEASGVVHVPGTDGLLFVDDGATGQVFWMRLDADGGQQGPARAVALGAEVSDLEGITTDGTFFYVVGSQSKRGAGGDGLVRFTFDPSTSRADRVERITGLKAWLAGHVPELAGTANRSAANALNIEAIAWDPDRQRLLLGLRAPVVDGHALVVPIALADGRFARESLRLDGGRALRLPLDGAGIRSLEHDPRTGGFKVITGPGPGRDRLAFRLVEWRGGESREDVRPVTVYSRRLKPEGIAPATLGGRQVSVVVFDVGRYAVTD